MGARPQDIVAIVVIFAIGAVLIAWGEIIGALIIVSGFVQVIRLLVSLRKEQESSSPPLQSGKQGLG